jgi:hypothetical protein
MKSNTIARRDQDNLSQDTNTRPKGENMIEKMEC